MNDLTDDAPTDNPDIAVLFDHDEAELGIRIAGSKNSMGLHGPVDFFNERGLFQRASYECGALHGLLERFDDGVKVFEQEFSEGVPHGVQRTYDQKARMTSEQYFNKGLQQGSSRLFVSGNVIREAEYVDGRLSGKVREYNLEGVLVREEEYVCGLKHGVQLTFWPDGKLLERLYFEDGIEVKGSEQFDSKGRLKEKKSSGGWLKGITDLIQEKDDKDA
jgi:antitoxin component YwqK of YwqJK toxin-antitoxin module